MLDVVLSRYKYATLAELNAILKGFLFSINHKMAGSAKGQEIIKNIPNQLLLTETDAPFTFSAAISTRIESLRSTIKIVAYQKK